MTTFFEKCQEILSDAWSQVNHELAINPAYEAIPDENLRLAIRKSVNSRTKSYRYVLPTQILAKLADPSLDSRCIQASRGGEGDFDARSLSTKVIVPFDRENDNVLGGAPEPYVNNPLRVPEVSEKYRSQQKDKKGWDDLTLVLVAIENKHYPRFTREVFDQTLIEIHRRLATVSVTYPIPKRISLEKTQEVIKEYVSAQSGGERVLSVISALMEVIGESFGLFHEVHRGNITAADRPSGLIADIECRDSEGNVILAVEVKDRELVLDHIASKLPDMRSKQVSEILYIAQQGIHKENHKKIMELVEKEFVSGQNIYVFENILEFSSGILALLGESGRRRFLEAVGQNLDTYGAAIEHRKNWADLLSQV